jgi:hypothetical protein
LTALESAALDWPALLAVPPFWPFVPAAAAPAPSELPARTARAPSSTRSPRLTPLRLRAAANAGASAVDGPWLPARRSPTVAPARLPMARCAASLASAS